MHSTRIVILINFLAPFLSIDPETEYSKDTHVNLKRIEKVLDNLRQKQEENQNKEKADFDYPKEIDRLSAIYRLEMQ